jgi:hypothetical protein
VKGKVVFAIVSFFILIPGAASADPDVAIFENRALSFTLKRTPAPYVSELKDTQTGTRLVSNPADRDLFVIVLTGGSGQEYIGSSTAETVGVDATGTDWDRKIIITYSGLRNLDLSATVHIRVPVNDPLTYWSIDVRNNTGKKIEFVQFPRLRTVSKIGNEEDDFIVLPDLPGTLIRKPWTTWEMDYGTWVLRFPGGLSAQFLSFQDESAGLYYASRDSEGYGKRLVVAKRSGGFDVFHDFYLPDTIAAYWHSPYEVAIGVTRGTWQDSADIYKSWAVTQPWCAMTLAQREDVPEWLKRGPFFYVSSVRTYAQDGTCSGSFYPTLTAALRTLRDKVGSAFVAMLADWENHRRWTAGDYFPVFDEENAKKTIGRINKEGFRPFFYLSGLNYSIENRGVDPSVIAIPEDRFADFVVDKATGDPFIIERDESTGQFQWSRVMHSFCVDGPGTKAFFEDVVDEVLALGVKMLQMDQVVDGAGLPCWSDSHGHEPGAGLYQAQGFRSLLQDMRAHGKESDADFALFMEEPHEELIPYLDGFHMREYLEKTWYRGYPGAVGIPLFTYLYHEYAVGYGGDSTHLGVKGVNTAWYCREHAVNLITGKTPAAATWSNPNELSNADPRILKLLAHHIRLLDTGAYRYLILGRMLHPVKVVSPELTYTLSRYENGQQVDYEFTEPAILYSAWEAPDGNTGYFFINLSQKSLPLSLQPEALGALPAGPREIVLRSSTNGFTARRLDRNTNIQRLRAMTLAPDEILYIEVVKIKK